MAELTTIARPYAKAAFDFAIEKQAVESWAEMLAYASMVSENTTMKNLLSGSMASDKLATVFIDVCGDRLDVHGQNLIKVMAEKGRLEALPKVVALFSQFRNDWAKEVEAQVVSAFEISEQQQTQIGASLEQRLARKVKLNCSIDPSLIAGVIIKAGDLVIDGSVKGKLNRLADKLQS